MLSLVFTFSVDILTLLIKQYMSDELLDKQFVKNFVAYILFMIVMVACYELNDE